MSSRKKDLIIPLGDIFKHEAAAALERVRKKRAQGFYLEVIDYSHRVYKGHNPGLLQGKFVQIKLADEREEYIVLYPAGRPAPTNFYHANIVELFCIDKGIHGHYTTKTKDHFEIYDEDTEDGTETVWTVMGGGSFVKNDSLKVISFYDQSTIYGKFDKIGLKDRILTLPEFAGYTVNVI